MGSILDEANRGLEDGPSLGIRRDTLEQRLRSIVECEFDFIWRCVRRLGASPVGADEAARRTFRIAGRQLERVLPGSERTYLFATAACVVSDIRRARGRDEIADVVGANTIACAPLGATDADGELSLDATKARALLDRVLGALPIDLRIVLVLAEGEHMSMPEIGELLGLGEGKVAARRRRALAAFRACVNEMSSEAGNGAAEPGKPHKSWRGGPFEWVRSILKSEPVSGLGRELLRSMEDDMPPPHAHAGALVALGLEPSSMKQLPQAGTSEASCDAGERARGATLGDDVRSRGSTLGDHERARGATLTHAEWFGGAAEGDDEWSVGPEADDDARDHADIEVSDPRKAMDSGGAIGPEPPTRLLSAMPGPTAVTIHPPATFLYNYGAVLFRPFLLGALAAATVMVAVRWSTSSRLGATQSIPAISTPHPGPWQPGSGRHELGTAGLVLPSGTASNAAQLPSSANAASLAPLPAPAHDSPRPVEPSSVTPEIAQSEPNASDSKARGGTSAPAPSTAATEDVASGSQLSPTRPDRNREISEIAAIRALFRSGSHEQIRQALDYYEDEFPAGLFRPDAVALRIELLVRMGDRAGARRLADAFEASHPRSTHLPRIHMLTRSGTDSQ